MQNSLTQKKKRTIFFSEQSKNATIPGWAKVKLLIMIALFLSFASGDLCPFYTQMWIYEREASRNYSSFIM